MTLVREADVRAERDSLLNVLTAELEGWTDERKFDWLYLENPFGPARCWVLVDEDGQLAGVSAAFPRTLRSGTREWRAWVLGDFCVASRLRSLGPAIRLQKAALEALEQGDVDLVYDFPSGPMTAVHRRLGAHFFGRSIRMVYLLRSNRAVKRRVGNPALATGLSVAGNVLLQFRAALANWRHRGFPVHAQEVDFQGPPSSEFGSAGGVSLQRTAEYLNWRYRSDPRGCPSILSLSGPGKGSIVYRRAADDVEILDVFGVGDVKMLHALVVAVIEEARAQRAMAVSASLSEEHPWSEVLRKLGFQPRESGAFVVYSRSGVSAEPSQWFFLSGDRD